MENFILDAIKPVSNYYNPKNRIKSLVYYGEHKIALARLIKHLKLWTKEHKP